MKQNLKKIIIIVIVLVIFFIIFMIAKSGGDENNDALIQTTGNNNLGGSQAVDVVGAEIVQALNQINSLNLDRTLFERPIYLSLIDRSQAIPPEPVGRSNPFAPIGQGDLSRESISINIEDNEESVVNNIDPENTNSVVNIN